jgi:hypothetical protein
MWTEDNIIVPKEIIESSKKNFISARCMEACAIIESKTFFPERDPFPPFWHY